MKNQYCENCGVHKDMHAGVGCKTFVPPKENNDEIKGLLSSAASSKAFYINAGYTKPKEANELIEMDALARNIVHYAKNSVMPFEQVVQATKERLEKAFREFSARPNPKPSARRANDGAMPRRQTE